jgi:hypothetical protein
MVIGTLSVLSASAVQRFRDGLLNHHGLPRCPGHVICVLAKLSTRRHLVFRPSTCHLIHSQCQFRAIVEQAYPSSY